jgi:hypothetical protein
VVAFRWEFVSATKTPATGAVPLGVLSNTVPDTVKVGLLAAGAIGDAHAHIERAEIARHTPADRRLNLIGVSSLKFLEFSVAATQHRAWFDIVCFISAILLEEVPPEVAFMPSPAQILTCGAQGQ